MSQQSKLYAISTGTVLAYDTSCGGEQLMFVGNTLMNTSLSQSIQSTQIYGGKGSRLLLEYDYQKEITLSIEDAAFEPQYLALQNGAKIADQLGLVYRTETVTFSETGEATLTFTPKGNVQVEQVDGTFLGAVPKTKTVTMPEMAGKETTVVYVEEAKTKTLTLDSSTFPSSFKVVLIVDLFDENKTKVEEAQITIPKFKPDGNFELSLTHDGVATSSLNGKALDDKGIYGIIKYVPVVNNKDEASCEVVDLVVFPSTTIELDSTDMRDSVTLSVRPLYNDDSIGVPYANTALEFELASAGTDVANVDAGVVTLGGVATKSSSDTITITDPISGKTKEVTVNII